MNDSGREAVRIAARRGTMREHLVTRGIPILVLVAVLGGAYVYWRHVDSRPKGVGAPPPQGPIPVSVVVIKKERVPYRYRFLGQTQGSQVVEIRARVSGYLQERFYKEGEKVDKGQKLFQIDPRPFQTELAQAKAGLASAEATLARAQSQAKRMEEAQEKGVASPQEVEDWKTQARVAEAQLQENKARIASAELQLGYTTIVSPITGMIGEAMKDTGSYVDDGQNGLLAVVRKVDPIYVRYSVTEQDTLRFRRLHQAGLVTEPELGQLELEITLADGTTYPNRGRLNYVDTALDEKTGTMIVRGQVPNPDGLLKPGQFVYATILGIERMDVVRVPQSSVSQSPTGASVMVVNEKNVAESRPVTLGEWSEKEYWIVEKGLDVGDRVITDRLMMVRPGTPVSVASTTTVSTTEPAGTQAAGSATQAATSTEASTTSMSGR